MKLVIEIPCNSDIELEENLNKAISDLSDVLGKKGFRELELTAYNKTTESEPIYKITLS